MPSVLAEHLVNQKVLHGPQQWCVGVAAVTGFLGVGLGLCVWSLHMDVCVCVFCFFLI